MDVSIELLKKSEGGRMNAGIEPMQTRRQVRCYDEYKIELLKTRRLKVVE